MNRDYLRKCASIAGISLAGLTSALADQQLILPPTDLVEAHRPGLVKPDGSPLFGPSREQVMMAMGIMPGIGPGLGMLAGGKKTPASIVFANTVINNTGGSTYTTTGIALGSAANGRYIILVVHPRTQTPTSVSIAGVSCNLVVSSGSNANSVALIYISSTPVPIGTTGTAVVVFSSAASFCAFSSYAAYNLKSNTADDFQSNLVDATAMNLSIKAGGVAVATAMNLSSGGTTYSVSGTTKDNDLQIRSGFCYVCDASTTSLTNAVTPITITASSPQSPAAACASFS